MPDQLARSKPWIKHERSNKEYCINIRLEILKISWSLQRLRNVKNQNAVIKSSIIKIRKAKANLNSKLSNWIRWLSLILITFKLIDGKRINSYGRKIT